MKNATGVAPWHFSGSSERKSAVILANAIRGANKNPGACQYPIDDTGLNCYHAPMKAKTALLITLALAVCAVLFVAAVNTRPLAQAQAQIMVRQPDPYAQILESRRADSGAGYGMLAGTLAAVLVGIGYFALSERTTKLIRTVKRRPARARTQPRALRTVGTVDAWQDQSEQPQR